MEWWEDPSYWFDCQRKNCKRLATYTDLDRNYVCDDHRFHPLFVELSPEIVRKRKREMAVWWRKHNAWVDKPRVVK